MASFKDENKSLKQQMFSIDKQFRAVEGALADQQDANERLKKEAEHYRKKYGDANTEKNAAFESLEQY